MTATAKRKTRARRAKKVQAPYKVRIVIEPTEKSRQRFADEVNLAMAAGDITIRALCDQATHPVTNRPMSTQTVAKVLDAEHVYLPSSLTYCRICAALGWKVAVVS